MDRPLVVGSAVVGFVAVVGPLVVGVVWSLVTDRANAVAFLGLGGSRRA